MTPGAGTGTEEGAVVGTSQARLRTSAGARARPVCPGTPGARDARVGGRAAEVAAAHPTSSLAWAQLADDALGRGAAVEAYAYAGTGHPRGRDALRRNGWRGTTRCQGARLHVAVQFCIPCRRRCLSDGGTGVSAAVTTASARRTPRRCCP
ncbi:DUF3151 family protein [Streptomyces sp. NPDC092370]|uniref:DUF3151 family protein n=1 Tax=Streptomyces sp. NPDC092370 TaxID=3366016 RepID=UPI0037F773B8